MNPKPLLNYIAVLLAALVIAGAAYIVWDHFQDGRRIKDLENQKRAVLQYIDSMRDVRVEIREKKALWIIIDKERKDSLKAATAALTIYIKKYEKLRSAPIVRYNEPQLDSVVGVIIRRHYPAVPN